MFTQKNVFLNRFIIERSVKSLYYGTLIPLSREQKKIVKIESGAERCFGAREFIWDTCDSR